MKKRKFLLVFILGASIIIMGILAVVSVKSLFAELSASSLKHGGYRLPFANSPLDKYDFTNCKVGIHGYGGKIYELTDKQNDNFFELLFMLDINKYGLSEASEYSGTPVSYEVKLKSGESILFIMQNGNSISEFPFYFVLIYFSEKEVDINPKSDYTKKVRNRTLAYVSAREVLLWRKTM